MERSYAFILDTLTKLDALYASEENWCKGSRNYKNAYCLRGGLCQVIFGSFEIDDAFDENSKLLQVERFLGDILDHRVVSWNDDISRTFADIKNLIQTAKAECQTKLSV